MKLPDHLSVSQLNTFLSCPLAYRFRYIDRIETGTKSSSFALGTAFHSAAERLHKDIIAGQAGAADDYCTAFDDALSVEFGCFDVQLKPGESADSLHQEGRALVELYCEHRLRQPAKLVAAELRIEQRLVNPATREELGVPFVAYLDLVERDGGGTNVVDLKTASRAYAQGDVDTSMQLTAYGLLMLLSTGQAPATMRIDAVVRTKVPKLQRIETRRSESDYIRFFELARVVWAAIQEGHYYPNAGWTCSNCEFARECAHWGTAAGCAGGDRVKGGVSYEADHLGQPAAGAAGNRAAAAVAGIAR